MNHFRGKFWRSGLALGLWVGVILLCGQSNRVIAQQPPSNQGGVNPSDLYLQAYLLMEDGGKEEKKEDYEAAFNKYKQAGQLFDVVARSNPEWKGQIVRYRRKKIREDLARVRELEQQRRAAQNVPSTGGLASTLEPSPYDASTYVNNTFGKMDNELVALTQKNSALLRELETKESSLRKVSKDAVDARANERKLLEKLTATQARLATAEARKERENKELEQEVERLKTQLSKATKLLQQSQTQSKEMLAELQSANEQIRSLRGERDTLLEERNKMAAILESANGADAAKTLAWENWQLKDQLEKAKQKIEDISAESYRDKTEILKLRDELMQVRTELDGMRDQNRQYEKQIAALIMRLQATSEKLAITAGPELSVTEAETENRVLRNIILRQLRQQSVREHAKKIALEQMASLEVTSKDLLDAVEQMAQPVQLDQQEQGMLKGPRFAEHLTGTGIHATLIAESTPGAENPEAQPGQDLSDEEQGYLTAAKAEFDRERFHDARRHLAQVLSTKPQNVQALVSTGVVSLRLNQLQDAEIALKKALAYDYENNRSHYLLGITYFQSGNVDEAIASVEQGLKIEPKDARARNYLGYVVSSQGLMDRAKNEFLQAVSIDPKFSDAHFNLAALYATDDDADMVHLARKHYLMALQSGAAPDPSMEKLIGLPPQVAPVSEVVEPVIVPPAEPLPEADLEQSEPVVPVAVSP
ncbi:MAG: tetratricopeptide (TPR) repeat protein [Verrucomicrobiales bacterium]|jgi:tetratricopeptide (TPR) repeat protein